MALMIASSGGAENRSRRKSRSRRPYTAFTGAAAEGCLSRPAVSRAEIVTSSPTVDAAPSSRSSTADAAPSSIADTVAADTGPAAY